MIRKYSPQVETILQLHFSSLSEKARRHYAAAEAMKLGHGGVSYISNLLGIDRNTIMVGQRELSSLMEGVSISYARQRKLGGGRKKNSN